MTFNKEGRTVPDGKSKSLILKFQDSEKVCGIQNDIFPLVITKEMVNFNVFNILIDGESYCDIM